MSKVLVTESYLSDIADSIRAKKNTADTFTPAQMSGAIDTIVTPNLQTKTVSPSTSSQTVSPDTGYNGLSSVTVNAISPTKAAQTYTPGTTDQTIASGRWLTGTQTIRGDSNLVAGNIKKDVSIFNITGTYEGSGGGGSTGRYEINISLTNPSGVYNFDQCQIYTFSSQFDPDNPDGPYYNTTPLVTVYNADESFDVFVPTDIWGIWIILNGLGPDGTDYGTCSVTGSLTVDQSYDGWVIQVSGDGTVTIDGVDYDP